MIHLLLELVALDMILLCFVVKFLHSMLEIQGKKCIDEEEGKKGRKVVSINIGFYSVFSPQQCSPSLFCSITQRLNDEFQLHYNEL